MKRVFGVKKEKVPPPTVEEAAERINKQGDSVDEKIRKLDAELVKYREQIKKTRPGPAQEAIKSRAMRVLKQKKMYEGQRDTLYNQTFNLDQVAFATEGIKDAQQTMAAMKAANKDLKGTLKTLKIEDIDRMQDNMMDLMDISNEIQASLGQSYNVPDDIDEDELLGELDALEADMGTETESNSMPSYLQPDKEPELETELSLPHVPLGESMGPQPQASLGMEPLAEMSKMGFARKLASPKNKSRERAISLLVTWLTSQMQIDDNELKKIWKGLFYCVWHSDKAPVQADLIERLASVHEKLGTTLSLQYFKVFLMTMRREWAGIDRLRLDKFYLLLRKCLLHMLKVLERSGWDAGLVETFMETLLENAFLANDQYAALGINLHYADVFFQELKGFLPITAKTLHLLLHPFLVVCANTSDKSLLRRIKENVFDHLFYLCRMAIMGKEGEESSEGPLFESSLGLLLLSLPMAPEAFTLASMPSTPQVNRKLLYEFHREYEALEKLANASCAGLPLLGNLEKKIKKRKKQKEALGQLCSDDKPRKRERKRKKASVGVKKQDAGLPAEDTKTFDLDAVVGDGEVLEGGNVSAPQSNGEWNAKLSKRKAADSQSESEIQGKSSGIKKKAKEKISVKAMKAAPEDSVGGLRQRRDSNVLGTNDSVVSKLEREFDLLADEEDSIDLSTQMPSSSVIVSPPGGERKKRKRASVAAADRTHVVNGELVLPAVGLPTTANTQGNSSAKVKKVRFALKKNLVWTPSTPLPAESLRVPPSATPRGSALKKGVLPGPIISETAMALKQRKGTPRRPATQSKTNKKRGNVVWPKRIAAKKGRSI